MPCCGNQRMVRQATAPPERKTRISLQYVGATRLTALGVVTGTRYDFDSPNAILAVDPRDAASLQSIAHLRRVYV